MRWSSGARGQGAWDSPKGGKSGWTPLWVGTDQSAAMPCCLASFFQRSTSLAISAPNWAGESGVAMAPSFRKLPAICGLASVWLTAWLILPTTSAGVPAGGTRPPHTPHPQPGTALADHIGGRSGRCQQAPPQLERIAGNAACQRQQFGSDGAGLQAGDAYCTELARAHHGQQRGAAGDEQLRLVADQVRHRRGHAAVRNVANVQTTELRLEQFGGELVHAARA